MDTESPLSHQTKAVICQFYKIFNMYIYFIHLHMLHKKEGITKTHFKMNEQILTPTDNMFIIK